MNAQVLRKRRIAERLGVINPASAAFDQPDTDVAKVSRSQGDF
jgi:hypothetical protein